MSKYRKKQRKSDLKKLEELEHEKVSCEEEYILAKDALFKSYHIRNLSICKRTIRLLLPVFITSGLTIGGFKLFGGGYPFYQDQNKKYKTYNLDYKSSSYSELEESYKKAPWYDYQLPDSNLTIYTPWEEKEGSYVRTKREYEFSGYDLLEVYNAVINEDYDYLIESLSNYTEEVQKSNTKLFDDENNKVTVDASIHGRDKSDYILTPESNSKNLVVTILELIIIMFISCFAIEENLSGYKEAIKNCIEANKNSKKRYDLSREKLIDVENKILILRNKVKR